MVYLTGPVHTLTDMQVEYNGLLMGAGTPYELPAPWTFLDLPPVKTMDQARTWADGSWSGPDFGDVFLPQVPVEIMAAGGMSFGDAVNRFRNTFTIQAAPQGLWVKLTGLPLQGITAKVAQRSIPIDESFGLGTHATGCMVQWRCPHPVWQSVPRTTTLLPPASSGALHYPLFSQWDGNTEALDYAITKTGPSAATLSNAGNTDAWPVVAVSGPSTGGFTITLDGNTVTYGTALATTDVVTIDYGQGRAYLSSGGSAGSDRTYLLTVRNFTPVPAGTSSQISFTATGGSATVTTVDAWR